MSYIFRRFASPNVSMHEKCKHNVSPPPLLFLPKIFHRKNGKLIDIFPYASIADMSWEVRDDIFPG